MHTHKWYCISSALRLKKKKKKKKKKVDLPTLLIFGPKGQTNLSFFRPRVISSVDSNVLSDEVISSVGSKILIGSESFLMSDYVSID